ncbi:DUF423 domain-containing protein [Pseudoteredinibacter isoporae]|uniref:Uncharacterized membrane protein YgdD (TMEM256/DUF423 family) n=1 Tax=Pseudoteredinibacter isoporae TaxID=570281 RepID=A0A7X0JRR7_9GAMM|nr:DUF423 domain-containing protein [Pseudoteredinibacter isoporae]MBB6520433.1 uncharacterized membrane protein YgdD (TMEM256/DUF423 family) [Pseudoteredinibacter isoporae]
MMYRTILAIAAINGLLAAILGAYGAHGLKPELSEKLWSAYSTANQYHFYHTLALLALAAFASVRHWPKLVWVAWGWQLGIVLFSGSIYALALGAPSWVGPITPLGGLTLMSAWALLFQQAFANKDI